MKQEQIAGILLCLIGLVLACKPVLVWKLTERWKTEKSDSRRGCVTGDRGIEIK